MDDVEDEDVIIEGSELHRALLNIGYTDFEVTTINKKGSSSMKPLVNNGWFHSFSNTWKNWQPLNCLSNYLTKDYYFSLQQLKTILKVESLLDDHAARIQEFMTFNEPPYMQKFGKRCNFLAANLMLGVIYLMFKRQKNIALFLTTSMSSYALFYKYKNYRAIWILKDLVDAQNELYHLYKKSLGILKNVYQLRVDGKKIQPKFSKLKLDCLKYLQPLMETLLKSMETVSRLFYHGTSTVCKFFPKEILEKDTISHFEPDSFVINGEVTYADLRRLYYVYILVQSDFMHLMAIAYNIDFLGENKMTPHPSLERVIVNLCSSLINEKTKLANILMDYQNCQRKVVARKIRITTISRWRDLYLNLDVLSKKLQASYDEVALVLEMIEKHENDGETDDKLITELDKKIQEIYLQIDKSRNFAEFSNLLITMMQRSSKAEENLAPEIEPIPPEEENYTPRVQDIEPQIIDEVFEEYITEEYLKPLYEEDDEAMEAAKFDKLLTKNFMSELKEALVEKCKSMTEREAKAWLRKYQDSNNRLDKTNVTEIGPIKNENSDVPNPPPLPTFLETKKKLSREPRAPVPLPRTRNFEESSLPKIPVPPAPPLPTWQIEPSEINEKLSISLPSLNTRKIPAFVTFEEEFFGSGENSEEELECENEN